MNGDSAVIGALQMSLAAHWLALQTYRGQAAHFARCGYGKLAAHWEAELAEESGHTDRLLRRLEALDTPPACEHPQPAWPRLPDLTGLLAANLQLEQAAAEVERDGVRAARDAGDEVSAELLAHHLRETEAAVVEIEATLAAVRLMGEAQYLSTQL